MVNKNCAKMWKSLQILFSEIVDESSAWSSVFSLPSLVIDKIIATRTNCSKILQSSLYLSDFSRLNFLAWMALPWPLTFHLHSSLNQQRTQAAPLTKTFREKEMTIFTCQHWSFKKTKRAYQEKMPFNWPINWPIAIIYNPF